MAALDYDTLQSEMKKKRICRFCLCTDFSQLTNIYMRDTRIKTSAPLPIQIMAIASIEIFSNDGMPCYVCSNCTNIFEFSYQFKQMCKKADNLLRQYPLTGKWAQELEKPILPQLQQSPRLNTKPKSNIYPQLITQANPQLYPQLKPPQSPKKSGQESLLSSQSNSQLYTQFKPQQTPKATGQESLLLPKKILNTALVTTPEPPMPMRTKIEKLDDDCSISFLDKIENNDELSIDDIQQLMASEGQIDETEFISVETFPKAEVGSTSRISKPRVLNKSSVRILNKEAALDKEPRLSLPKIKKDVDGNMEIVAEILDIDEPYENEPDPKIAEPIETNVFPCPHCERSFPLLQLRDIHLKNHARDRKFNCEECDKCFFSKYDLQRHSFTHNGEKPFKCSACNKAFSRASLLSRHEKTHTDIPKYLCIHCERAFLSKEDMDKHAERHNINRPFQCKLCHKGFAFKQGLERHEVVHSRQQPYSCQYCSQSFSTTTKLARHLTAHAGERPYPCKFCKKSYLLSHHLTRHLRSHTDMHDSNSLISFMCSSCDACFESRDELIQHSTKHASEENLACPLCKECFDSIDALTSHIRDHSNGEAYACEFCDLIFMTADKLQQHTDIEHTQEMEAYHEDDRAQADKKKEDAQRHGIDAVDENLHNSVDEYQIEDMSDDANESLSDLKKKIKVDTDELSPKIINQIIIRSPEDDNPNDENKVEEHNSLLIPLKQRKIDSSVKKITNQTANKPKTPQQPSPQLRRKTPAAATNSKAFFRDTNQPTIQSLLKLPKDVTVTRAPPSPPHVANHTIVKTEQMPTQSSKTVHTKDDSKNDQTVKMKTGQKKVKIQKITLTKAEAAAMAKDGRIKIKDGKIILNK